MAKLLTTFVFWRGTLVAMKSALAGAGLTNQQSAEGYALLQALQQAGVQYDLQGDDSPLNPGSFSTGTCQPYMDAAVPSFLEFDRVSRYLYALYASTVTLAEAQAFGLYPGATVLPDGIQSPPALVFTWATAVESWALVQARGLAAAIVAVDNGDPANEALLLAANTAAAPYFSPPVNPNPSDEFYSVSLTTAVNAAMLSCTTWLTGLSFQ
jgi:hypothetical protein